MAHIITLTGSPHCGKSTISRMFMDYQDDYFMPVYVNKYSTRKARKMDEDVYCVDKIPPECDLVYEQYGVRYGISLESLYEYLEKGLTPIIVVNDIRAVEDIKSALGGLVVSIFLYQKPAVFEDFYVEEKERAAKDTSKEEISEIARTRFEKAQAIYRIYIENIQLFDKVVLNVFQQKDATQMQVKHIVDRFIKDSGELKEKMGDV